MSRLRRFLIPVLVVTLVASFVSMYPGWSIPTALMAQDEGDEPEVDLQSDLDLGDGGQPEGYSREIVVNGQRYLFDRMVPDRSDELELRAELEEVSIYATDGSDPAATLYLVLSESDDDQMARYFWEQIDDPAAVCPAEGANVGRFDAEGTPYVFAGMETDLTPDDLQEVGSSDGARVYADVGTSPPFPELFLDDEGDLLRFVALVGDGRPAALAVSLAMAGVTFPFEGDVTGQVDPATLTKVGCAGPFAVYTDPEADESAEPAMLVLVGRQVLRFAGQLPEEGTPAVDASPTIEATPGEPTTEPATPTEEQLAPTATEEPTETPEPTFTEEPTETPESTATETLEPTLTPEPTVTPAPTETPEPTATGTAGPTFEPTATETATATATPTETPEVATDAGLPEQVEVQGSSYVFQGVATGIDLSALTEVETITVDDAELTVYASGEIQGVAPELYCVTADGQVIGRYAPAAIDQPAPPEALPSFVEIENTTYVFNEVEVDIDITVLTEIQTIVVQNTNITVYVDQGAPDQPVRIYLVGADGQVVGQYVQSSVVAVAVASAITPEPTEQLQPPAVVPTLPPDVQPPAVATASVQTTCPGDPGPIDARGVPDRLPTRVQLGGTAYSFIRAEAAIEAGELTRIGCVGPFEATSTSLADRSEVLYLRVPGQEGEDQQVYRYEAASTFQVQIERTERAQVITAADQRYRLTQTWVPSIYSDISVVVFVAEPELATPETVYTVNVYNSVVGDAIGEYRLAGEADEPSEDMITAAQQVEINPDLTINGSRYILVNVYRPVGTTTNGFMTLFSASAEGTPDVILGRDLRDPVLYIFQREGG